MDKLWAFHVFVRVAEAKSFSRAAQDLDLANGTVSSCIRNLETHLGVTLIQRDTRRLTLTEEGARLLPHAKSLLENVERIEDATRGMPSGLRGPLRVEVPISIGNALLFPALAEFAQRYPEIRVTLMQTNQPHHMIEEAIDLAIRMDAVEDDDLVARPLLQSPYLLVCQPALAARLPAHPGALEASQCLGVIHGSQWRAYRWQLQRGDERLEIQPEGPLALNSAEAVLKAVRQGMGVGMAMEFIARPFIATGEIQQVYPDWHGGTRQLYLATTRSGARSARVMAFADFLLELLRSTAPQQRRGAVAVQRATRSRATPSATR